jgi:hypothetical protein
MDKGLGSIFNTEKIKPKTKNYVKPNIRKLIVTLFYLYVKSKEKN